MRKAKVAIATPNRAIQVKLFRAIGDEEHEVIYAEASPQMIQTIETFQPHLLFLQASLGETDGIDLCRKIKTTPRLAETKIVILSSEQRTKSRIVEALADGFLPIPFHENEVRRLLAELAVSRYLILLVDDSRLVHSKLTPILTQEGGYLVLASMNGKQAMEVLEKEPIDVILSDIEMPEMDGFALCAHVKQDERWRRIPFILCSSLQSGSDIEKGFKCGADDYIVKPVVPSELLSRLRKLFDQSARGKRERILVVDDSRLILNMIQLALEEQGFQVDTAIHGADALDTIRQFVPDLVITDYEMPVMDGVQLCINIRQQADTMDLPIIMLTARTGRVEQVRASSTGINGFVVKPFTNEKVLVLVEKLLAERRLRRERKAMKLYLSEGAQEAVEKIADSGQSADEVLNSHQTFRTILFSDIVSFTTKSEGMTATQVVDMLNSYFDRMTVILKKHDAIIDKFIGDAIMALFGKRDNGPLRAVRAAREMIDALESFNGETGHNIQVRIGVNSGEVVAGDIGSKHFRVDHTVIGDNVNTAQRLETAAKPNEVVISQSTYEFVKDYVEVEEVGPFKLKGKANPVPGYKVVRVKDA